MSTSQSMVWLAADYHLPSTYSYRIPMSSMTHAPTLPTPGPATVRLALIRRSMELFGVQTIQEAIFPILRAMQVRIRPPERVAISPHRLRGYKWEEEKPTKPSQQQESLMLREMAHAQGPLTIYLQIPMSEEASLRALLQAIGYWGQTDSLASCLQVYLAIPQEGESVVPLLHWKTERLLRPFFSGLATEFRDPQLSWEEVTTATHTSRGKNTQPPLVLDLYLWPLLLLRHTDGKGSKLFQRQSLREAQV
jgi:CRISPR-associated Cas5-like protein